VPAPPAPPPRSRAARFVLAVVRIGALLLLLGAVLGFWGWRWAQQNLLTELPEDLSSLRSYRPPTSCRVYAARGELVDEFYLERRIWVPIAELPPYVWQAFIAAEDRRFWEHTGVDFLGIARAMVVNLRSGRSRQGGSTITQQLVKNLLVGKERSYVRKLREAVLAYRLEKALGKEQILELYVNFIALGSGNYGVEAAALDYFGISARQLDPGQAAMLAGLVPAPSRYSPRNHPDLTAWRRELVLRGMVEESFLEAREASEYLDDPVLVPNDARKRLAIGTAYATMVRRELRRIFGEEAIFARGLQVQTPLDLSVQAESEQAVRDALVALEGRQGRRGAVFHLEPADIDSFLDRAPGLARDPASGTILAPVAGDCLEAVVGPAGDLGALLAGPHRLSLLDEERRSLVRGSGEKPVPAPLMSRVTPGDVLRVCVSEGTQVRLDPRPWAEGAAVAIENATGRVVAMVGGWDVALEGFVRATQAQRQPGSSFKPYVYGAALLDGMSQLDTVMDAPIALPGSNGKMWSPHNYDGKFHGRLPMRNALAKSLNTVAVRLTLQVGAGRIAKLAQAMGVSTPLRVDPTIALGSSEVTPMDQAMGYLTIARMGVPAEPVYIDSLRDPESREVGRAGGAVQIGGATVARLPGGSLPRAMPAGVAYELADMMREVVLGGTARSAMRPNLDRAGKTGTTNGFVDAWFVGFTPRYTTAVWVGTDGTLSLGTKETGGKTSLPAWIRIVEALPHVEGERFAVPDEALLVESGGRWVGVRRGGAPKGVLAVPELALGEPLPEWSVPAVAAGGPVVPPALRTVGTPPPPHAPGMEATAPLSAPPPDVASVAPPTSPEAPPARP
jgi:penicillin-binding protein 1A